MPRSLRETALPLFLALWMALTPGFALAGSMTLLGVGGKAAAGGAYTGPGDVVSSGVKAYVSCTRAWNASYASAHSNACDLIRTSDSTTCTMVFATNGNADVSTTSSCTTGTQTVTAFCASTTCKVSKAYDETGNGFHFTQATGAAQPTFDPAGAKVMVFAGGQELANAAIGAISQIYSVSIVAKRTSGTSTTCILCTNNTNEDVLFHGANTASIIWGSAFADVTATDGSCHALEAVGNGASSSLMVDGSANTGLSPGSGAMGNTYEIGAGLSETTFQLTGTIREVIIYASDFTSSQSALSTNQTSYGGC